MKRSKLKGKALVAQSGGCTAVINQSLAGVIEKARGTRAITDLYGSRHGIQGLFEHQFVDFKKYSAQDIRRICSLPSAALGSSRYKMKPGEEARAVKLLEKQGIRYLFMIGGNDTSETLLRISRAAREQNFELRTVHIPKTIDNDLMETDHCPGYGSVARFAAIATQEAGLDTRAMKQVDPVKIIEFMGRNSGWIVAASALLKKKSGDPPHLLYLPEVPFDQKDFLRSVERSLVQYGYCVICISETIRDAQGRRLGERTDGIVQDPFGHRYVEGAAVYLARRVEENLKVRARYDKPGTLQRMSIPYISASDQKEAYTAGKKAVEWATQGRTEVMVAFKRKKGGKYRLFYEPVSLDKIPGRERYLPATFMNKSKKGVSEAFVRYALPLIGNEKTLPDFSVF